jgi:hypothetical protein
MLTWSVLENRVLRTIFGPNRDEVTGGWRKLRNEELHNLYSSPSIITMIKSSWARHVAQMGEKNAYRILVGKPEGNRPLGRPRCRWTILKWFSGRQDGVMWVESVWFTIGTSGGLL